MSLKHMRAKHRLLRAIWLVGLVLFSRVPVALAQAAELAHQSAVHGPVSLLDALAQRVVISSVRVSPDGDWVAFSSRRGAPREDVYESTLAVMKIDELGQPIVLDSYKAPPSENGSQFRWSPDSRKLLYTTYVSSTGSMELRMWGRADERSTTLLTGHDNIRIANAIGRDGVNIHTFHRVLTTDQLPRDLAIRMQDNFRFYGLRSDLPNPQVRPPSERQAWEFRWVDSKIGTQGHREQVVDRSEEADWDIWAKLPRIPGGGIIHRQDSIMSPDGGWIARVQLGARGYQSPEETYRFHGVAIGAIGQQEYPHAPAPEDRDVLSSSNSNYKQLLGWSRDGHEVMFIERGALTTVLRTLSTTGALRTVLEEDALLRADGGHVAEGAMGNDARWAVLVRSTNLTPEELVKVDLATGDVTVLFAPNADLSGKPYASVRYVELSDGPFYGRLYVPANSEYAKPYPLVFALYVSTPGFEESVGDELPILALAERGIAVFTFRAPVGFNSFDGDFRFELARVERPRQAMEDLVRRLGAEGIVDPTRVGVVGLSYGSEIAMYCYWRSNLFRAVSSAEGSWSPSAFVFGGPSWAAGYLEPRGIMDPNDVSAQAQWRQWSAALNARADLPPLLLQTADDERNITVEPWFRLRRAGAQVEWLEYPNEGHEKSGPANKWWVYQRNLDWFRFWLKDEEDPDPAKARQYVRWHAMREKWQASLGEAAKE